MSKPNRNLKLALNLSMIVVGMVLLTAASVPLYRLFCDVTGFGGTPRLNATAQSQVSERTITVRFNADVMPDMPWRFEPDQKEVVVRLGEEKLVSYSAANELDSPVKGTAVYNVLPNEAGIYFNKIECFCYQEQTLGPKQSVHMPISFFVDPAILADPQLQNLKTITLSYTFFPVKNGKP